MSFFERLYEEHENAKVRFVGFTTESGRYDFGIVYTNMFFGKPLIICMQTGRSTLLDSNDVKDFEYLQKVFKLGSDNEASELALFFENTLPSLTLGAQYD